MVSERHIRNDIRTGRHNFGLNHQSHMRKHPGHLNQIANRLGAGGVHSRFGAVAVASSGTVGLGGCSQRKCSSCGGCNCCG